jgi:hypothetical protein
VAYFDVYTLKGYSDWVDAIAFAPDSKLLASASRDKHGPFFLDTW